MFPFLPDPQRTGIRPPCLISSFFQRIITCCCGNNLFWNMTEKIILAGLKLSCIAAFTSRWPILFSRKKPSTVCSVHKYRNMWPNDRARGQNTPTSDFWLSMLNLSLSGFQKSFPVPIFEFKVEHTLTLAEWEWPPLLFQSKSVTESKTIKCRWGRNYNMEERLNAVFDLFAKWGHENYIGKCYI